MNEKKIYIYAETAFSHEGNLKYLYQLIDKAYQAKVDGIKFQILLEPTESYSNEVLKRTNITNWMFTADEWKNILIYVRQKKKLDIILLPVDLNAFEFCEKNEKLYDFLEIHSINFNHLHFLEKANRINKIIILGIGGRTLSDIEYAITHLDKAYLEKRILLMHGFQSFPTKKEDIKLAKINMFKKFFDLEIGYADHTAFDEDDIPLIQFAYLNGARVFEKHIILEQGKERTDYQAAVDCEHIIKIRNALEELEIIQGGNQMMQMSDEEKKYRNREKRIVALKKIEKGEKFTKQNIGFKVTDKESDFDQKDYVKVLGNVATWTIEEGDTKLI